MNKIKGLWTLLVYRSITCCRYYLCYNAPIRIYKCCIYMFDKAYKCIIYIPVYCRKLFDLISLSIILEILCSLIIVHDFCLFKYIINSFSHKSNQEMLSISKHKCDSE